MLRFTNQSQIFKAEFLVFLIAEFDSGSCRMVNNMGITDSELGDFLRWAVWLAFGLW